MKIRLGFISNSSSSSFLIYGVAIDVGNKGFGELENLMTDIENKYGLSGFYPPDSDYIFFGKSWDSVGDDQTGLQFKREIAERCKKAFGENIKTETHEDAWYDG